MYYTWVKWAEPSAEALRQACLARQSRISQDEPQIPQIYITKLDVTNSKFLGSFAIEFNKQYSALIGGRGTGKSTVLEYLRWGLCDQTANFSDDLNDLERRRHKLIEKTLSDFDGEVRITFTLNGINHIIKRKSHNNETTLKIDGGDFRAVTEEDVRKILPIQAYSQKQLSSVGVSTDELKRFIETPISTQLSSFDFRLAEINKQIRSEYLNVNRKKELEKENDQINLEINSLNNQVRNLRQSLSGISEEQQRVIAKKSIYDAELNIVNNVRSELNTISTKVNELSTQIEIYPQPIPTEIALDNPSIIAELDEHRAAKIEEIKGLVNQLKEVFTSENTANIREIIQQWEQAKLTFDTQYEAAKASTTSNLQQLTEIQRIELRLVQLQENVNERLAKLIEIGTPEETFNSSRSSYWALHREKLILLIEQARKFSELSNGLIKVLVDKNIDLELIKSELIRFFQGTRINQDKILTIVENIGTSSDPLTDWEVILEELRTLAELKYQDGSSIQFTSIYPKLAGYGLNEGNLGKIAELSTTEMWLNIATVKIEFTPDFKYTTNSEMEDVIAFSEASAGQQATALLTVLLNQPGAPLLIDQPEDDIDNRAIDDIIKNIWAAKKHRQIIFTSHNANLVVNGDAELVVCFDYRDTGSQTRGTIKAEGAIDSKSVKDEITSVMEGGEKAFKLRKDKYGY